MKPIMMYESIDGVPFRTAKECADYESHCKVIAKIIDKLPRFPIDEPFKRGESYYLHDGGFFTALRTEFFMYLDSQYPRFEFRAQFGLRTWALPLKKYTEIIISLNDKPVMLAWRWLGCVDNHYRQWANLLMAEHPPEHALSINQL